MQTSIIHNDTELIGCFEFLLSGEKTELLYADDSVFDFFCIVKPNTVLLCECMELEKHANEIKNIAQSKVSFNIILKNSLGYFDVIFNVKNKDEDNISISAMLFKSHETDMVFVAASLSADGIFRYNLKDKKLYLYRNNDGEFKFLAEFDNFEKYCFEHNFVAKEHEDSFRQLCSDVFIGKNNIENKICLSDGNGGSPSTYCVRAKTLHSENEDTVMGLIINASKAVLKVNDGGVNFDQSITDFAFDLIDRSPDTDDAINLLLTKIAKYLSLDRAVIFERQGSNKFALSKTYCCYKEGEDYFTEDVSSAPKNYETEEQDWSFMISAFEVEKYLETENVNQHGNLPEILLRCADDGKSALFCSLYDRGSICGVLCCESTTKVRKWDRESITTAKSLSKVISSFLLKIRAYQRANITIERLTNFDRITGLPEANKFKKIAVDTLRMEASPENLSLIYYDFNSFKYLNEQYGIKGGDSILRDFGLAIAPNSEDTVSSCRIFSDMFISLVRCPKEKLPDKAIAVTDAFCNGQKAKGRRLNMAFSIGFYTFRDRYTDISTAMDNAALASKTNKNMAETSYAFYEDKMTTGVKLEIEMLNNAITALINKEFVVFYQPKIALETSQLVGGEALVRWKKPDGTMVPPDEFIPCLEKNGFITVLDFYVYEEVCRFIKNRIDNNLPVVPISVNVSMLHLKEESFLQRIEGLVNGYGIPPHLLEFELTESVFLENQQAALDVMAKMRGMGFMVSIDDFGSGFSSLNMLKNLPVDILKIDKEFFSNNILLNNDQIILSSIINMASRLHISVICEGVETTEQIKFLRRTECDMVQGYFYSKPVSEEVFMDYNMHPDFASKEKE